MSEYKNIISLNQLGVRTVKAMAKKLPEYPETLKKINEKLQHAMDEYGDGLGNLKERYKEMINDLTDGTDAISGYINGLADYMNERANDMQQWLDEHTTGDSGQTGGTSSSLRSTIVTDEDTKKKR